MPVACTSSPGPPINDLLQSLRCSHGKYSNPYQLTNPSDEQKTQFVGNDMKDRSCTIENSTSYISAGYADRFDYSSLHHLVASGQVLYSDGTLQANGSAMLHCSHYSPTPMLRDSKLHAVL